jgi:hypothetical protein
MLKSLSCITFVRGSGRELEGEWKWKALSACIDWLRGRGVEHFNGEIFIM